MNRDEAFEAVRTAIARIAPEADLSQVPQGASLREELDLDSMDFLALVEALAQSTGVSIPESDYAAVDGLEPLVTYLTSQHPSSVGGRSEGG
jgi:acyl carrier protein